MKEMIGVSVIAIGIIILINIAIYAMRPDCPSGTVPVLSKYSGWACLAGEPPL